MFLQFSQILIIRIQKYFKQKHSIDISDEVANEYLHSLAGMFAVLAEMEGGKSPPDPLERTGGADPV